MTDSSHIIFRTLRTHTRAQQRQLTQAYWRTMRAVLRLAKHRARAAVAQSASLLGGSLRGDRVVHECMGRGF